MIPNLRNKILAFGAALLVLAGCTSEDGNSMSNSSIVSSPLFTLLDATQTNITFQNQLSEGLNTNILVYEYFYNGGGVATADFNGDELIDIYFTANMSANKLYLNSGDLKFQDITNISKAGGRSGPWKTGVSVVDINADGKLDIYLCYSGAMPAAKRANELYVNQGNDGNGIPIFNEEATKYGLASTGFSNQAYFLDADKDGDLDMLLLNHNPKNLPILNEASTAEFLKIDDNLRGLRYYKNVNGFYTDETQKAGISGSALSYGLGLGISDFNEDGWPDFYVSNDYAVPDYYYVNNGDGTFTNELRNSIGHTSQFSMGNDVADINNDGLSDIFTLDMLPEDNKRQKLLLAPDNYNKFDLNVRSGFYYQYMRNMLQLNNGNGTFSEVGQLVGVSNTDWSWSALLADYDNDGWKDLYITNGYFRDYTNLDFIKYMNDFTQTKGRLVREDVLEIIKNMPSSNVVNYAFSNEGGVTFSNQTKNWGLERASNSNGAAYADLDNDGDLDLVVNNINQTAFIYQNEAQTNANNFLKVKLNGLKGNSLGIGAKVKVFAKGKTQLKEQQLGRGYLSSVSPVLHFGLGDLATIDSLKVIWASGQSQTIANLEANQLLELNEPEAKISFERKPKSETIFSEIASPIDYKNPKLNVRDFDRQSLLINEQSFSGPIMISGDIDQDEQEEVFIGGTSLHEASIYHKEGGTSFKRVNSTVFKEDRISEDTDAVFFDVNGDGHLDLYIASGGYHRFSANDEALQDRLYLNDGKGGFKKSNSALPQTFEGTSTIAMNDVNKDGFTDLFVGGGVVPGRYPESSDSYFLINDGSGKFNKTNTLNMGLVTDAAWVDLDQNGEKELVVVGDWMAVKVFDANLKDVSNTYFEKEYNGWWNSITVSDVNNDQSPDLILGNMGMNTQFSASENEPLDLYFKDFDGNGTVDPIFSFSIQGVSYPYVTRDELLNQMSQFRSKFTTFESYSPIKTKDLFTSNELAAASHLTANHMKTTLFINTAGKLKETLLPNEVQYAPVYGVLAEDFNQDGNKDLLLTGNNSHTKLRFGTFDASFGSLLLGNGNGGFKYVEQGISGLNIWGNVRSSLVIGNSVLFGINGGKVKTYKLNQ